MIIEAGHKYYKELNAEIKAALERQIEVKGVIGQRYLGTGVTDKELHVYGTPGNAMGAYLNGCNITVYGNVQDAVGDTMDNGEIVVHGNCGDTLGYGMRGGAIYVKGNGGYRVGIHMKAYLEKHPVIVLGGHVGSFLGEYQAGGTLIVLGLDKNGEFPAGNYCGTGMHGGEIYIRSDAAPTGLAREVEYRRCTAEDMAEIQAYLDKFIRYFNIETENILDKPFYKITPIEGNPYHNLYTPH